MTRATKIALAVGTALALGLAGAAVNASPEEGWGAGGWCPGFGSGYHMGSGYGMGPGMMYGYGGGGGYGMGPGAMGGRGYGMGPGMMYGYGYGPRHGAGAALNLTDEQRSKVDKIQQDLRSNQWDLRGKIQAELTARAAARDDAAASKADDQIASLQQQMIANATAAKKQIDAVLTPEQRQRLRREAY